MFRYVNEYVNGMCLWYVNGPNTDRSMCVLHRARWYGPVREAHHHSPGSGSASGSNTPHIQHPSFNLSHYNLAKRNCCVMREWVVKMSVCGWKLDCVEWELVVIVCVKWCGWFDWMMWDCWRDVSERSEECWRARTAHHQRLSGLTKVRQTRHWTPRGILRNWNDGKTRRNAWHFLWFYCWNSSLDFCMHSCVFLNARFQIHMRLVDTSNPPSINY